MFFISTHDVIIRYMVRCHAYDCPRFIGIACSAHDGLPDQWKDAHGFSASDNTVANKIAPNGYTYLENYLNGN